MKTPEMVHFEFRARADLIKSYLAGGNIGNAQVHLEAMRNLLKDIDEDDSTPFTRTITFFSRIFTTLPAQP